MEYVYTAMLLHSAGTEVSAKSVEKVLKAAGVKADKSRAAALVASLEGVDIEEFDFDYVKSVVNHVYSVFPDEEIKELITKVNKYYEKNSK